MLVNLSGLWSFIAQKDAITLSVTEALKWENHIVVIFIKLIYKYDSNIQGGL